MACRMGRDVAYVRMTDMTAHTQPVDAHSTCDAHPAAATPSRLDQDLALLNAAESGDVEAIEAFIKAGVDPNASNRADNTALHYAAWRGRTGAINTLLAAGADPDARNVYRATPLPYCCPGAST